MQDTIHSVAVNTLAVHGEFAIVPAMAETEWQEFVQSVREKGILIPIDILPDGRVLDGRHRLKVAKELGIEHVKVIYHNLNEIEAIEFIRDTATKRRSLSAGQKVAVVLAAKEICEKIEKVRRENSLSNLKKGEKKGNEKNSSNPHEIRTPPDGAPVPHRGRTNASLSKIAGVGETTIRQVKRVQKSDPKLFEAIKQNKISAKAAYRKVMEKEKRKKEKKNKQPPSIEPTEKRRYASVEDALKDVEVSEEERAKEWLHANSVSLATNMRQIHSLLARIKDLDEIIHVLLAEDRPLMLEYASSLEIVAKAIREKTKIRRVK